MKPERLSSLDAFRGLTVAGMILVNNAGDWGHVFGPLEHAAWHGCTPTDLIFPFFLFIVGVSITLSLGRRAPTDDVTRAILRRAAILFALGLLLNAFPFTLERPLRVLGVLQRIALCYLVAALLAAHTRPRTQLLTAVVLLLGYALLESTFNLDVPGADLGAAVDRLLLAGHLHQAKPEFSLFDPEGLFSTIPAIGTTLIGVLAGRWLGDATVSPHERASGLFFAGLVLAIAGRAVAPLVPINKSLWTSSYVLHTGGLACGGLAACYWLMDLKGVTRWAAPFLAFGRNPIVAFWASHAIARLLVFGMTWEESGKTVTAKQWLYQTTFARGVSSEWTSFAYAATYLLVWWLIMAAMDSKKIYIKV
jgi:predicted acyltransferase